MQKFELDHILEKYLPPADLIGRPYRRKKKVTFSDTVAVNWPDVADRLRLTTSCYLAKQMAERDLKLLALVYRDEGRHKGHSEEDPAHPNFPFPSDYKRIDFDNLDPYKLNKAAEYLRSEQKNFEEPFYIHARKLKVLEKKADEVWAKHRKHMEAPPSLPYPVKAKRTPMVVPHPPYSTYKTSKHEQ